MDASGVVVVGRLELLGQGQGLRIYRGIAQCGMTE